MFNKRQNCIFKRPLKIMFENYQRACLRALEVKREGCERSMTKKLALVKGQCPKKRRLQEWLT